MQLSMHTNPELRTFLNLRNDSPYAMKERWPNKETLEIVNSGRIIYKVILAPQLGTLYRSP
jgi:hypothetical protein